MSAKYAQLHEEKEQADVSGTSLPLTQRSAVPGQHATCAFEGCGKDKLINSEYCSHAHEEQHIKHIAQTEGLEAVCESFTFSALVPMPQYRCLSCGYGPQTHCCASCASVCHRGHDVVMFPTSQALYCDCGLDHQCVCMPAGKRAKTPKAATPSPSLQSAAPSDPYALMMQKNASAAAALHHSSEHFHALRTAPAKGPAWNCSRCRKKIASGSSATRYRCIAGCDFDLCQNCLNTTATGGEMKAAIPYCVKHPAVLANNTCAHCGASICGSCVNVLNHRIVCSSCQAKAGGGGCLSCFGLCR